MFEKEQLTIAVDFDGTIVEDAYPQVGKPKLFAIETLKMLQEKRHKLILWTYRSGKRLDDAVRFCEENGIELYAVNKSYPEEVMDDTISRKINADVFIDDRNVGGFPGWGEVYQLLNPSADPESLKKRQKKGGGLFSIFKK